MRASASAALKVRAEIFAALGDERGFRCSIGSARGHAAVDRSPHGGHAAHPPGGHQASAGSRGRRRGTQRARRAREPVRTRAEADRVTCAAISRTCRRQWDDALARLKAFVRSER